MRTVRIEVTAEDIAAGLRNNACQCPVARAAQRACNVESSRKLGVFRRKGGLALETWDTDGPQLPKDVVEWVYRFDGGLPCEPFSFELELP